MPDGMTLTYSGRDILALALTGKPLVFTRAFVGTGDLGTRDPLSLTDLIHRHLELPITAMRTSQTGVAEVTVEISNKDLVTGFFMKEYGLFAKHPDTGREVLYSYCNKGNTAGYLEGFDGTNPVNVTLSFITVIDQAQNITANITNTYSYVTANTLDARIESLFAPYDSPAGFFSFNKNDKRRLRPTSLQNMREVLIGTADIISLINRIERLEDAINQINLSLNVQEIYPAASHFIAEDFLNPDSIDLYSAQVTSIVAGDDSIDCIPIEGLLPGSIYLITDSYKSEYVQIESVNIENGIMRVILYEHIQNTYNLDTCRLIRTTADISNGAAYGAGTAHKAVWIPAVTWKGLGANETFSVPFDTTISNQDSFSFSGNAVLDDTGCITLKEAV